MNEASKRFSLLLDRYLQKKIIAEELQELSGLLETLDPEIIAAVLQEVYENTSVPEFLLEKLPSETILANIIGGAKESKGQESSYSKNVRQLFLKIAAAAIITGLVTGLIFYREKKTKKTLQASAIAQSQVSDIAPGGNKATLKIANGATIVLTNSPNGTLAHQGGTAIKKVADGQLVFDATYSDSDDTNTKNWNTVSTPRGGQYQLMLPDGSKVWLNAESSLKFPSQFTGEERSVELVGEAYFEIAKNAQKAFKVMTNHMEVQVLGTDFNLVDYNDESTPKTTLVNGAVKIKSGEQTQLLKPGQQVLLTKHKQLKLVEHVDVETEIAWKNGLFLFKDASIQKVMDQVARWYDIEVVYENNLSKKLFNGSVSRNVNLSALMNMLAYTGVHYEIEGRKVWIKN